MAISLVAIPPVALLGLHLDVPSSKSDSDRSGTPFSFPGASAEPMVEPTEVSDRQVLVVDDEPDIRTMLRTLLQDEGYLVNDAADGVIGLERIRASSRPLIVLLDYKMPRMNGEEMLNAVMADPQLADRHAFIFITANLPLFSPALRQLLAAAAIPVIQKPFKIPDLLGEIDRATVRLQDPPDLLP